MGRRNAGTARRVSSWTRRGRLSRTVRPRVSRMQPPLARTLRTQSELGPYVSATTYPPGRRKTFTGVRCTRCDLRPTWTTTPKPGKYGASGPRRRLVPWRLKRAIPRGNGIDVTPDRSGPGDRGRAAVLRTWYAGLNDQSSACDGRPWRVVRL